MSSKIISIRKKILTTITWVLAIIGTIAIVSIMLVTYQQMDSQKIHDIKELALEKSEGVALLLKDSSDLASHIATFPELISWTENSDQKNTADAIKFFNTFNIKKQYLAIYLLDQKGTALISTDPTFTGNDYSFRPYFQKAIKGAANMDVAIGVTSKAQGYYFAEPIIKNGHQIIGVLVIKLSPDSLYSFFKTDVMDTQAHVMLTDEFGVILYSDVKERIFSSLGPLSSEITQTIGKEKKYSNFDIKPLQYGGAQDMLAWPKAGVNTYNFFDNADKEPEIIAVAPIPNYSLFLVSENSSWLLSLGALQLAAITGGLIIISILLVIFFLSRIISNKLKPLKNLKEMAKNIGDNNLDIENNIKSGDELEELGGFIKNTADKLKEYYTNLEQKVEQRTKELNENNAFLNKTKVATLNILEDVENEKNKTAELAKSLEKFKLALDNISERVIITDPEGIVIYGNTSDEKNTGFTLAETIGKKAGALRKLPMPQQYYQKLWKTIKIDKKIFDGEIKNRKKNGEIYDAKLIISPVLNGKKEVEFFIGIERDITHEKMVDAAKTEFVSLASHQLRTPLSSINWYAEMLLAGDAGKLTAEQKNFVDEIYSGNQRMVELVNSLLNVSRLELGTFAVEPEPTDVIKVAQSVLNELKPTTISKKIKVTFIADKELPIIQADPKLIRIIFQNLLSNATKYTPEKGAVTLKISKNIENLLIEVRDNGYGISKADQPRIFEKLFRGENVREKDTEGTGLGLYIVKSIVEHSGGKISFISEENKGTTFYLEIPLSGMKKKEGDKKIE